MLFPSTVQMKQNSLSNLSQAKHSFRSLGTDYSIDIDVEHVPNSRLVLFNKDLAQQLNLVLPKSEQEIERIMLENFAWFKHDNQDLNRIENDTVKTFFSTRYQDSDDKSEGSALGDGRAIWVGEIINQLDSGRLQYQDVVLKGTGSTELAWLNHPKESHKDGQLGLTEAVHEYIYSLAAKKNGINAVGVLAVIELPFLRKVDNEMAAIVVRVGNHLRFAHYCYFTDNAEQLKKLFEYGLKRDMGLPLTHFVNTKDISDYLELIVTNLALDAAIYFDVHAVHGSPTFGNITSCGGAIDFATFVYTDAHHGNYSYMSEGENLLGGVWGQTEQFFNLFSILVDALKKSRFDHVIAIKSVEYYLESFNERFEQVLTSRWLKRIGLSDQEIDGLSIENKERFYENVKMIYELNGSKKIKFNQGKVIMAAFEPRKILSETAGYIEHFNNLMVIWEQLFKVHRSWGTFKLIDAKPYIKAYQQSINNIVHQLGASKEVIAGWHRRSKAITLSERNEPGADFFYNSERFFASKEVLKKIHCGKINWPEISEAAELSTLKLADHGIMPIK